MSTITRISLSSIILIIMLIFFAVSMQAQNPNSNQKGKKEHLEHIEKVKENGPSKAQKPKTKDTDVFQNANGEPGLQNSSKPTYKKDKKDKPHNEGHGHTEGADKPKHVAKGKDHHQGHADKDDDHLYDEGAPILDTNKRGHGYGKDKGDLSGREFGQQRAAEAKLQNEARTMELKSSMEKGDNQVKAAKEKIKAAKVKLEKDKNNLADDVIKEKEDKIKKAEAALQSLEKQLKRAENIGND